MSSERFLVTVTTLRINMLTGGSSLCYDSYDQRSVQTGSWTANVAYIFSAKLNSFISATWSGIFFPRPIENITFHQYDTQTYREYLKCQLKCETDLEEIYLILKSSTTLFPHTALRLSVPHLVFDFSAPMYSLCPHLRQFSESECMSSRPTWNYLCHSTLSKPFNKSSPQTWCQSTASDSVHSFFRQRYAMNKNNFL